MSAASILDAASEADAAAMLRRCCGASRWVDGMLARRPFGDDAALHAAADEVWATCGDDDVKEALTHHPEIGASLDALRERFASTITPHGGSWSTWSSTEQSGVAAADEATLVALRDGNVRYRERFGHIFVVCATGKSAAEMLALLHARIDNDPAHELRIAAAEQGKITHLRLEKLA